MTTHAVNFNKAPVFAYYKFLFYRIHRIAHRGKPGKDPKINKMEVECRIKTITKYFSLCFHLLFSVSICSIWYFSFLFVPFIFLFYLFITSFAYILFILFARFLFCSFMLFLFILRVSLFTRSDFLIFLLLV